jgi:hypothetical protein
MKAIHPFIAASVLILVTISTSILISGWSVDMFSSRSSNVINATETKLYCHDSNVYLRNITYVCGDNNCFSGAPYKINVTAENSGSNDIVLSNIFITMSSGESYQISGSPSSLASGSTTTRDFDAIIITANPPLPV